jgi:opacity protein-like surface antigen
MKKLSLFVPVLLGLAIGSLQAGPAVEYKQVAPPPPPLYGVGFYGAIDGGANVYQNFDLLNETFRDRFFGSGTTLELQQQHDVGGFGGIKLGYVFGTGVVRPTVEGDFFYNGFNFGTDATLRVPPLDFEQHADASTWVNSGAFMVNFILRFAPGNQRFQPYVGAGVGAWYAHTDGVDFRFRNLPLGFGTVTATTSGFSHGDLAWQAIGGADYYWTPRFSTFIEYHYLDYTTTFTSVGARHFVRRNFNVDLGNINIGDLGQHLVGAGLRFHF